VSLCLVDYGAIRCSSPADVRPSRFDSKFSMPPWLFVGLMSCDWTCYPYIDVVMSIIDSLLMSRMNGFVISFWVSKDRLEIGIILLLRLSNVLNSILLFTFEISRSSRRIALAVVAVDAGVAFLFLLSLMSFEWVGF